MVRESKYNPILGSFRQNMRLCHFFQTERKHCDVVIAFTIMLAHFLSTWVCALLGKTTRTVSIYVILRVGAWSYHQLLCLAMLWRRRQGSILLPSLHIQLHWSPPACWPRSSHKNTKSQNCCTQRLQVHNSNHIRIQSGCSGDDASHICVGKSSEFE